MKDITRLKNQGYALWNMRFLLLMLSMLWFTDFRSIMKTFCVVHSLDRITWQQEVTTARLWYGTQTQNTSHVAWIRDRDDCWWNLGKSPSCKPEKRYSNWNTCMRKKWTKKEFWYKMIIKCYVYEFMWSLM